MTNQRYFDIRITLENHRMEATCPSCGNKFTASWLAVHNVNNEPICDLCAWESATALANLLSLNHAIVQHYNGEIPKDVCEALKKRKSDPKRLRKELQEAHDFLDNHGHASNVISPLAVLLAGQIKDALKSKNVETMKEAKRLFEDSRFGMQVLDDEIPF